MLGGCRFYMLNVTELEHVSPDAPANCTRHSCNAIISVAFSRSRYNERSTEMNGSPKVPSAYDKDCL